MIDLRAAALAALVPINTVSTSLIPLTEHQLRQRLRAWTAFFIFGLVVSGLTAIPLETELEILERLVGKGSEGFAGWIHRVAEGLRETNAKFPFLAYGTDWLAFGHLVIAVAFIGAWRDPVRNKWLFQFGMIACVAVVPWALVFGEVRGIPLGWRLIDGAFGVVGFFPMWHCDRLAGRLEESHTDSGRSTA